MSKHSNKYISKVEKQVFEDTYNLQDIYNIIESAINYTKDSIDSNINEISTENLLDKYYENLATSIEVGSTNAPNRKLRECKAGCSVCCTQLIPIMPFEAFYIALNLTKFYDNSNLLNIKHKIKKQASQYKNSKISKFGKSRINCAFLSSNGMCGIHNIRPARCRGYFSYSKSSCENNYKDESEFVPADGYVAAWVRGAQSTISNSLQSQGYDSNYYEMHNILDIILSDTNSFNKWLAKEDIFSKCPTANASPEIIWQSPQENGETVIFRNANNTIPIKVEILK